MKTLPLRFHGASCSPPARPVPGFLGRGPVSAGNQAQPAGMSSRRRLLRQQAAQHPFCPRSPRPSSQDEGKPPLIPSVLTFGVSPPDPVPQDPSSCCPTQPRPSDRALTPPSPCGGPEGFRRQAPRRGLLDLYSQGQVPYGASPSLWLGKAFSTVNHCSETSSVPPLSTAWLLVSLLAAGQGGDADCPF